MAIAGADCILWRQLRRAGLIPLAPTVLEIGRANWYGDVTAAEFAADRQEFAPGSPLPTDRLNSWLMADWYYRVMLRDPVRMAIDLDPFAPDCLREDLNSPLGLSEFDLVINTGTCEHVFNQGQVWKTCHEATKVGGLMVHALPLWGWLDHGFYNYQPTFVADLAAENSYEIVLWLFAEMDPCYVAEVSRPEDFLALQPRSSKQSAMMYVVYRKTRGDAFRVPMQGVYSERATPEKIRSWQHNRGRFEWAEAERKSAMNTPQALSAPAVYMDDLKSRIDELMAERQKILGQAESLRDALARVDGAIITLRSLQGQIESRCEALVQRHREEHREGALCSKENGDAER